MPAFNNAKFDLHIINVIKTLKSIIITLIIIAIHSCGPNQQNAPSENKTGEYEAVRHTIEQSIGWAIEKDFEAMYKLWAEDLFHFWRSQDFRAISHELRDLHIHFSQNNDVPYGPEYGYQIWLGTESGHRYYMAMGWGGQFIIIVPELKLVITATCWTSDLTDQQAGEQKELKR